MNLSRVRDELRLGKTTEAKKEVVLAARQAGWKVERKKYPNGVGYIIYPDDARKEAK